MTSLQSTSPISVASQVKKPAALTIPEVIVCILSSLPRKTLQQVACSVCREWYLLTRPFLYPTGIYWLGKVPLTRRYILESLENTQNLPFISSTSASYYVRPSLRHGQSSNSADPWTQLQRSIQQVRIKDPESYFTELIATGNLISDMETLEPVRCFFTLLTRIRIENTWMETIPLATILQNCSCLLHLDVESTFHRAQEETSTTGHGALRCEEKTLSRIVLPESAFSTTLTRLNLSKIKIGLWALERLLLSCRTRSQSNLLDLTLKHIVIEESPSLAGGKTTVCSDPQPIVDHIHQWCPSLRCLHFSMFDYKPTQLNQAHLFKRFSAVQKWGIPHSDILPSTFLSLQAYVNHVTALELTCSCDGLVPLALHEYLCNSPQLRNLWVSNILFPAEYLDLDPVAVNKAGCYSPRYCHDESSSLDTKRAKSVGPTSLTLWLQKRVWACRNLETLQIKFDGLVGDTRAARNSRVMFSYLALVCPHLRELRITRDKMNLELEGGLCYLGALEELEKLILQTKHIWIKHVSDIEWIRLQSATAEAAAAAARTRKTMGAITGSNRISRLDSGISRTTTRTTLASRGGVPFQRSKTWMSREGGKRNLLSRLVGQLLERGPRRLLGLNRETGEMTRTRTIADQQGADSSAGDGHPRSMEEKTIIQRLISMSKPGNVGKAVERMERNKVRAEARQDEDEVGYCWPDMEMLVLDAAKYSGISDESLEQTVSRLRPDIAFHAWLRWSPL